MRAGVRGMGELWAFGPPVDHVAVGWTQIKQFLGLFAGWVDALSSAHEWLLDKLSKLIAPIFTIAAGSYAIYQRWYFAENKLRLRLSEFLARENRRLEIVHKALEKHVERPGPGRAFKSPVFSRWGLKPAFYASGVGSPTVVTYFLDRVDRAEFEVVKELEDVQSQLALWDKVKSDFEHRKARAHLCRGAISACKAAMALNRGRDDRLYNLDALNDFEEALRLKHDDKLALELAAHMRVRLGEYQRALQDFTRLAELASQQGDKVTAMRAFKFAGEVHTNKANPNLLGASAALNSALELAPEGADPFEIAELHELQGRAREAMGYANAAAMTSYEDAERFYAAAKGPEALEGLLRSRVCKNRIERRIQ